MRCELEIFASEGVAVPCREICERHSIRTAYLRIQMVHLPGEAVGRKPFGFRVRINKSSINLVGRSAENPMKSDRISCHGLAPCDWQWPDGGYYPATDLDSNTYLDAIVEATAGIS